MAITIIKMGVPPEDLFYRMEHEPCKTIIQFQWKDVSASGAYNYIVCPCCKKPMYPDRNKDKMENQPPQPKQAEQKEIYNTGVSRTTTK